MNSNRRLANSLQITTSVCLIGLIFLSVSWELWLAPLRPGGSWLVLKVLPLMALVFGILRGKLYTYRWSTLLIWLYFTEGVVRAWSDTGFSSQLATLEWILALIFFGSSAFFTRVIVRN
jgi:uncharacterized membrane protein